MLKPASLELDGHPPPLTTPTGRWLPISADGIELFDPAS